MTPADHLAALRVEADAFHGAVGDLDVAVPACPAWQVGGLVRHLGSVHRMFARVADEAWMRRPPRLEEDDRPDAEDPAVQTWARTQTTRLLAALGGLDPSAPRWNFTDGPQVGAFISRRMLHETAVHRFDLEDAYGAPSPIPRAVARDGVDEFLEVQLGRSGEWPGDAARVRVEVDGEVLADVELTPGDRARVSRPGEHVDLVLRGGAEHLLLCLWGRRPLGDVASGSAELAGRLRAFART